MWERIKDWVLLFVLLAVSVATMLTQNEPLLRGLRARALSITGRLEDGFAWVGGMVNAIDENNYLREENIRLSSEVARSREALLEHARLLRLLGLRDSTAYTLLPARIIAKDLVQKLAFFDLNVGSDDGVEPDMAVIDARGILGRITLVDAHYARAMSYLNTDFFVPARIQPLQVDGIVRWEGERLDQLLMELVVKTEPVTPGQRVVTSGYSSIFPPGLPIGTIEAVFEQPGQDALRILLEPSAPLADATHAFVVLLRPRPVQGLDN